MLSSSLEAEAFMQNLTRDILYDVQKHLGFTPPGQDYLREMIYKRVQGHIKPYALTRVDSVRPRPMETLMPPPVALKLPIQVSPPPGVYDMTEDNLRLLQRGLKGCFEIKQWFFDKLQGGVNSPPSSLIEGVIESTSDKAVLINGRFAVRPSSRCRTCGRPLTHPVSLKVGIGPTCYGKMYKDWPKDYRDIAAAEALVAARLSEIKWLGWLPKRIFERVEVMA